MARKPNSFYDKLSILLDHYTKSKQDMDTRRTRKNGWNDIINAYMGKIPKNWPFLSQITDPVIRTAILEKNNRLINAKLQGRLVPREGGDSVKAKINNALLDFQWDNANKGGAMIEKISQSDMYTRLFGASFAYIYWNNVKNCNELKVCDPRDIFIDWSASHIRNARWVQYREFTTIQALEDRGFDIKALKKQLKDGDVNQLRSNEYSDIVKSNRGLEDRIGEDKANPTVEIVTEWTDDTMTIFAPKYELLIDEKENPYDHKNIPFVQLRYYPLVDDIWGESEVESVLPLQRALWATLSGFVDQSLISMRPPIKVLSGQARIETIEYGPGARWIMNNPNAITEHNPNTAFIQNFNSAYPALVARFNTALGDNSLGVSNVRGSFDDKTATEVRALNQQQNNRDQANQVYLAEFIKDFMMMWVSNNKQYLFDDPSKKFHILKIIGQDNIAAFQQMQLDGKDIPDYALSEIEQTISESPDAVSPDMISKVLEDTAVPTSPVFTDESDMENPTIKSKLDVKSRDEAELYIEPTDMVGVYDYIPDVKSMATGAGQQAQDARMKAYELILANPNVLGLLSQQGETLKAKELVQDLLTDAGSKDAERYFQPTQSAGQGIVGQSTLLLDFLRHPAWDKCLKPFLLELADKDWPNPKEYQTQDKLLLDYTYKRGGVDAIKSIMDYLLSQEEIVNTLKEKERKLEEDDGL